MKSAIWPGTIGWTILLVENAMTVLRRRRVLAVMTRVEGSVLSVLDGMMSL